MNVYLNPDTPNGVIHGQTVMIILKSNPSTGFEWNIDHDPDFVGLVKREFKPYSSAIGGGGEEVFVFQTKKRGETKIRMKYQRKWDTAPREIKTFILNIR